MSRHWTFGQKLGAGFAAVVLLAAAIGAISVRALRGVVRDNDRLITVDARLLIEAQDLLAAADRKVGAIRGFLLLPEERFLESARAERESFQAALRRLRGLVVTEEGRRLLDAVERAEQDHQRAADRLIARKRAAASGEDLARAFEEALPARDALGAAVAAFVEREERRLDEARQATSDAAAAAIRLVTAIGIAAVLVAAALAFALTRTLARQIGAAVGRVQSSSAELQAAAGQQAAGAREQATAMSEITTTINELLATSRQISESAQRVARIAAQTAEAAGSGQGTVRDAGESVAGIRRQMEQVVQHMLDLGRRSQQIGAVLDIVSELAEQTNILAINATIEAAGAGDAGRRFAVVAEEIRRLADRVAGSTKEIRSMIEDVRGAVGTTVLATETGSKTVEAGARQFSEVSAAFGKIAGLVDTTTEAAREIELSTRQQSTAVEQVNTAVANVAQATRETESSATQTQQTATQLAGLSADLARLVRAGAAA